MNWLGSKRTPNVAPIAGGKYCEVDVAIVAESTYPYLRGGVSAVIQDIVEGNPDLTFGIIHVCWDSKSPHENAYDVPSNVQWVAPIYLSMTEHAQFKGAKSSALRLSRRGRHQLSHRLFDALEAVHHGDIGPLWSLYDDGFNPRTRKYPLWALLGTEEFMVTAGARLAGLEMSLTDSFWLLRDFASLAYALLSGELPKAKVYHAHTTGYASLVGAAAARQHGTRFLLTEHNLYVRDTVNTMLKRNMALSVRAGDWREFDVTGWERAWMAWWIEMGRTCYPSASRITYLYPSAIEEAAELGAPVERALVIPNGMAVEQFEVPYTRRMQAMLDKQASWRESTWRFAYIARIVPIKGLTHLIDAVAELVGRGVTNFHLDILGHAEETPEYYQACLEQVRCLGVGDYLTFHGSVNVREALGDIDVMILPSYNEGQPVVVLEAMTAGIPVLGTDVGGMAQLVEHPLITSDGRTLDPGGVLVEPATTNPALAQVLSDQMERLMSDRELYRRFAENARARVCNFFRVEEVAAAYNELYRDIAMMKPRRSIPAQRVSSAQGPPFEEIKPEAALGTDVL